MLHEGGDRGPGQWLGGGGVALIVAAYYGWKLLHVLRARATIVRVLPVAPDHRHGG